MPHAAQGQSERRDALKQLLQSAPASTQNELVAALTELGFMATQSSVSRDLRELGAVKTTSGYQLPREGGRAADEMAQVASLLRDIEAAGPNLLVIRTAVGAAQRVALALDRSGWDELVGNVGGDDTVFAATRTAADQRALLARIRQACGRA